MSNKYPSAPGWKPNSAETSQQAAVAVKEDAATLRERVYESFRLGSATADEIADRLGVSILSVRPRVAELHKQGRLKDTTYRRKNDSGHNAVVWQRVDPKTEQVFARGPQAEMF